MINTMTLNEGHKPVLGCNLWERQMNSRDIVRPVANTSEGSSFAFDCVYSYQTFINYITCTFKGPRVNKA